MVALVDDEDYERVVSAGKWFVQRDRNTFYAKRAYRRQDGKQSAIRLHTFLTGWPLVDHRNGNGLDNRRANLREATHAQNAQNRRMRSDNRSGFRGVSWVRRDKKWRAAITANGELSHLGDYVDPEAAARAYDTAAIELHGEFARLNFPLVKEKTA